MELDLYIFEVESRPWDGSSDGLWVTHRVVASTRAQAEAAVGEQAVAYWKKGVVLTGSEPARKLDAIVLTGAREGGHDA